MTSNDPPPQPLIRVVRGEPAPDELAALTAILLSRSQAARPAPGPPPRDTARWRDPSVFRAPGDWTAP
ncbi:acyl-CoA carboxylase subunit epsilon [Streptomyces sp. ISL-98]|uniref:acyl-CoA carboxylase subunit epsilon n=1 Tax=Streptomyces sp. ISL-98 TaxID=2819192 RepID=UPI001BE57627|nr:acyl-CoA carboxylase subunit epsilon [Streptomyces sp. ISL-98]MBT2510623.1 acyl-CoA carboxylase subunit epsilon [Streptomyces sp. ISL-98]